MYNVKEWFKVSNSNHLLYVKVACQISWVKRIHLTTNRVSALPGPVFSSHVVVLGLDLRDLGHLPYYLVRRVIMMALRISVVLRPLLWGMESLWWPISSCFMGLPGAEGEGHPWILSYLHSSLPRFHPVDPQGLLGETEEEGTSVFQGVNVGQWKEQADDMLCLSFL